MENTQSDCIRNIAYSDSSLNKSAIKNEKQNIEKSCIMVMSIFLFIFIMSLHKNQESECSNNS